MSVAIAIGGSLGGLTAAIRLKELYDTVYCLTGFGDYVKSGHHGKSRGLRTINLESDLLDIVIEGWDYWQKIGISGKIIEECIIHRFSENINYKFCKKHEKLLEILDKISPKCKKRESKQLNENTLLEDTGIYRIQEIVSQLEKIALEKGVKMLPVHVTKVISSIGCVYCEYIDKYKCIYDIDCEYCVISIGNEIKHIISNLTFTKPISVWNEFSFYNTPYIYYHDGIWTWGTTNYLNGKKYKERLGFYIMVESPQLLKVACDTSFIHNKNEITTQNLFDYRKHKNNFVSNVLNIKFNSVSYKDCYYSVAPFVQHSKSVSIINSGGFGYCVPGFVLRAINNIEVPPNTHYNNQLFAEKRHDLSTYLNT
jgi:hypothetical protein